ncbi:hypothetical protein GCM10020295_44840 [Streptomyces cinereospinus]
MRWLVGWSSTAAGAAEIGSAGATGHDGETLHPVGSQLLWGDPDPLWAVGDWRPDEVRLVTADAQTRIAVLGICGATDEELRLGLLTARGGALRHLTAWPGSYTAVVQAGRRITVCGDLAGARPVFHTPWAGGTAYATAALPLADLVEANLDFGHLAAVLAAPDVPAALHDSTPYDGVRRIPPGHALILRAGAREVAGYEPVASSPSPPRPPTPTTRSTPSGTPSSRPSAPASPPPGTSPAPTSTPGRSPAWAPPNGVPRAGCRCPASERTCPAGPPRERWRCWRPGCRARRAPSWDTARARASGCWRSPSTTWRWAAGRPSSSGRARWPPTPASTTWW